MEINYIVSCNVLSSRKNTESDDYRVDGLSKDLKNYKDIIQNNIKCCY